MNLKRQLRKLNQMNQTNPPTENPSVAKCALCGRFTKEEDLLYMAGDSDDLGGFEEWLECKKCTAPINLEEIK